MPVIKINNLNKVFGDNEVLKDINLEINQGEVVAIIGPSGSGKSTLLRCMNLLEVPTKGQVIFEGNDLTEKGTQVDKLRQKMGMVFQNFNLFPHKKVVDNIILAPKLLKKDNNDELHKEALSLLDRKSRCISESIIRWSKTKGSNCKSFSNASRCYFIR